MENVSLDMLFTVLCVAAYLWMQCAFINGSLTPFFGSLSYITALLSVGAIFFVAGWKEGAIAAALLFFVLPIVLRPIAFQIAKVVTKYPNLTMYERKWSPEQVRAFIRSRIVPKGMQCPLIGEVLKGFDLSEEDYIGYCEYYQRIGFALSPMVENAMLNPQAVLFYFDNAEITRLQDGQKRIRVGQDVLVGLSRVVYRGGNGKP